MQRLLQPFLLWSRQKTASSTEKDFDPKYLLQTYLFLLMKGDRSFNSTMKFSYLAMLPAMKKKSSFREPLNVALNIKVILLAGEQII